MKVLLIEDELGHCEEYKQCAEFLPYKVELSIAHGGERGIELALDIQPDIILLDLELQNGDKDGLLFLSELKQVSLDVIPFIIIITHNVSSRTYNIARQCGADYIFPKWKQDYSPRLVLDFSYNYYVNQYLKPVPNKEKCLEEKIACAVEKVGITNGMGGRAYIIESILIILTVYPDMDASSINLKKSIYPVIAKKHKKSVGSIEQGIKNAIQKAWLISDIDTLINNYTATVSYTTGYPMNKDFIFYFVDKLKGTAGLSF